MFLLEHFTEHVAEFRTTSEVNYQTYKLIKLTRTVTPCSGGARGAISQSMPQIFIYKTLLKDCLAGISILICHGVNAYYFSWMKTNDCVEE